MFFSFSPTSLSHNWIGPLITDTLLLGMQAIDKGDPVPSWPPPILPDARKAWLKKHSGFGKYLGKFFSEYKNSPAPARILVARSLADQTNLPGILTSQQICSVFSGTADMRSATEELFEYLFGQLSCPDDQGSAVRDRHYRDIYDGLEYKVCAFCGITLMRGKDSPRHHLDHWMAMSVYPFAGADLRNLCPMCEPCNLVFKGTADVLYSKNRIRRPSSDPYFGPTYKIELSRSKWGSGTKKLVHQPEWVIDFIGVSPAEAETWDSVLKISSRFRDDVLDPEFQPWISHFARWFNKTPRYKKRRNASGIISSLNDYVQCVIQEGFSDRAFLKAEVCRYLEISARSPVHGADVTGMLLSVADALK